MTIKELVNPTDPDSIMSALKDSTLNTIEDDATNLFKTASILKLYIWSGATVDPALAEKISAFETAAGRELTVVDFLNGMKYNATTGAIYFDPTAFLTPTP